MFELPLLIKATKMYTARQTDDCSRIQSASASSDFWDGDGHLERRYRQISSELAEISDRLFAVSQGISEEQSTDCSNESLTTEIAGVKSLISARERRSAFFAVDLFADPAWDILLDLYLAEIQQRRTMTTSLCIAACVPATTALRWINLLVERGLLARRPDPLDARRMYVMLTPLSKQAMRNYLGFDQNKNLVLVSNEEGAQVPEVRQI